MILDIEYKVKQLEAENQALQKELANLRRKLEEKQSVPIKPGSVSKDLAPSTQPVGQTRPNAITPRYEAPPTTETKPIIRNPQVSGPFKKPYKYYAGLQLEYAIPEDVEVSSGDKSGRALLADGVGFGVNFGYQLNEIFRGEFGFTRRVHKLQNIIPSDNSRFLSGQGELYTMMINGYFDVPTELRPQFGEKQVTPYLGFGIGPTYLRAKDVVSSEFSVDKGSISTRPFSGSIWLPSAQLIAGFNYPLTDRFGFDFGYRYFLLGNIASTVDGQAGASELLRSHSLKLGTRYRF